MIKVLIVADAERQLKASQPISWHANCRKPALSDIKRSLAIWKVNMNMTLWPFLIEMLPWQAC